MKVRYIGGSASRHIALTGQTVQRGEEVEVPDELGARLIAGRFFEEASESGGSRRRRSGSARPDESGGEE